MAGLFAFFKGQPTEYVIKYVGGSVRGEGAGLAFWYLPHATQIVAVPTSSVDQAFVFNEVTSNFQSVTIQGQFTYRVQDPRRAAELLNFTIEPRSRNYVSGDPEKLAQRIANVIQMETRSAIQTRTLEQTIAQSQEIAGQVEQRIREAGLLQPLAVELLSVYFLAARPTPEVAKALEADYRETLLRKADEAIYARRAAAVEEERKIKERELSTEVTLEQQRRELIELQGNNAQQEAEMRGRAQEAEAAYRARAWELELGVYKALDPRTILALAMKDIGANAGRIGNLTITSEVLASLMQAARGDG